MNKLSRVLPPAVRSAAGSLPPEAPRDPDKGRFRFALTFLGLAALAVGGAFWPSVELTDEEALTDEELRALMQSEPRTVPTPPSATALDLPATIRVTTEAAGAEVWLDGERAGATPVAMRDVRPGLRTLRVVHNGQKLLDTLLYVARGAAFDLYLAPSVAERSAPLAAQGPVARRSAGSAAKSATETVEEPRVGWQEPKEALAVAQRRVGW
jgi:hypothetical protein